MDLDRLLAALRAAAEPTRLRILAVLAHSELSVSDLVHILGQSQPRVSRHLKLLCDAGLLDRFREGNWAFFRMTDGDGCGTIGRLLTNLISDDDPAIRLDRQRLETLKRARAESASRFFSENAARWAEIRSLHIDEAEVERALFGLLPEGGPHDFLDVGTGTGRILEVLGRHAVRGIGIDQSREMLALARANLQAAGLAHCQVRRADMYQLPWPNDSFDLVSIHQVLHFAESPADAVVEAARVLRPGGRLIVVDFAPHSLDFLRRDQAHRRLGFADDEIAGFFRRAGLGSGDTIRLPSRKLTVQIWVAGRPASERESAARALARAST